MDDSTLSQLNKIISSRSTSGVIVFSQHGDILYLNTEAQSILSLYSADDRSDNDPVSPSQTLPDLIKESLVSTSEPTSMCINSPGGDSTFAIRILPLNEPQKDDKSSFLVLIEGVTIHRKFDMKKIQKQFSLSKRESEVTFCLTKGLTNKEIANALSLSVETINGYIKQVMQKFNTTTRAGVVGKILL
jgi:DNA-binding CsgD family transcriptional regulator